MHAVAQLIQRRLAGHTDNFKLALVGEISGQLWTVTAGMAARLQVAGLRADILGGSSGSGGGALYFAAGQFPLGATLYKVLGRPGGYGPARTQLVQWRRLGRAPVMDTYGLVYQAMTHEVPLNWSHFQTEQRPVFLMATGPNGAPVLQRVDGQPPAAVQQALYNSCLIPWLSTPIKAVPQLWDGGLSAPLPIEQAFKLGATHVLVLRASPGVGARTRPSLAEHLMVHTQLHHAPALAAGMLGRFASTGQVVHTYQHNPQVLMVQAPQVAAGPLATSAVQLLTSVLQGWRAAEAALSLPPLPYPALWQPDIARLLPLRQA
jgi:hypothetical protein